VKWLVITAPIVLLCLGVDLWNHETPWYAIGWVCGLVIGIGLPVPGGAR
jgi:hypothetical protein